jgi:diacylglycerol kinase family enzyme
MYILLYNPISRNRHGEKSLEEVIELISPCEYEAINVLDIKDYKELFDSRPIDDVFVVIGGDGTLSKFLNFLPITAHKIMFYAGGTGNDFMRNFDEELVEYKSTIDRPYVQTDDERKFCNGFGTGVDTLVVEYYDQSKSRSKLAYFYYTLKAFFSYKPATVSVEIDGVEKTYKRTYLVAVQNGKYFGGGMKVAPDAQVDDGLLDVIIIHNISRAKLFMVFPSVYSGKHVKFTKHVEYLQGKEINITQEESRSYTTDGEIGEKVYNNFKITL